MSARENFNSIIGSRVIKELEKRNFEAYYCNTKEEAKQKALSLIEKDSTISWGGSETLKEIGLINELRTGEFSLIDREQAQTPDEITKAYHDALNCDYYLMSTNAMSYCGKLVNMDGRGNRIAALIFGPKNVIVIAGINKLEKDEESAIRRVRRLAAPINSIRIGVKTPCVKTGICHDCLAEECICCHLLVTRMSREKGRIKVILVGEELGF